jgi:hypothetical protein
MDTGGRVLSWRLMYICSLCADHHHDRLFLQRHQSPQRLGGLSRCAGIVNLFSDEVIMDALRTTLLVSVIASLVACLAGTAAALGIYAMKRKNPLCGDVRQQHPPDQRGHRHRRVPFPAVRICHQRVQRHHRQIHW